MSITDALDGRGDKRLGCPLRAENADKSHWSDTLEHNVEIQGGAASKIRCMGLQKDLRRPSPFIAQQGEEFPFRVELGGGTELGQHLARDTVDTHAGPLRALTVARVGDLPKQGDHAQLLSGVVSAQFGRRARIY